jgi:hypothetical protein
MMSPPVSISNIASAWPGAMAEESSRTTGALSNGRGFRCVDAEPTIRHASSASFAMRPVSVTAPVALNAYSPVATSERSMDTTSPPSGATPRGCSTIMRSEHRSPAPKSGLAWPFRLAKLALTSTSPSKIRASDPVTIVATRAQRSASGKASVTPTSLRGPSDESGARTVRHPAPSAPSVTKAIVQAVLTASEATSATRNFKCIARGGHGIRQWIRGSTPRRDRHTKTLEFLGEALKPARRAALELEPLSLPRAGNGHETLAAVSPNRVEISGR